MSIFSDKRFSLENIFDKTPNLYWQVPAEIHTAIEKEIAGYNFSGDKKEYIVAKIEGSIAGDLMFDSNFKNDLNSAATALDRQKIIRDYLRAYIKREVNLEIANIQKEIKQSVVTKNGSVLSLFDPRWKKEAKAGDYSQYEEYRKNVTDFIFPTAGSDAEGSSKITASTSVKSDHTKYLEKIVSDYNDGKIVIPAGMTPQAYFDQLSIDLYNASSVGNYVHRETGELLSTTDLYILSNIDENIGGRIKNNLAPGKKVELLNNLKTSNTADASKNYIKRFEFFGKVSTAAPKEVVGELLTKGKTSGLTPLEFSKELLGKVPRIAVNASGKASLEGVDVFKKVFDNTLKQFDTDLKKNHKKAIQEFHHSNTAANVSNLKFLIHQGTGPIAELTAALEKNELAHDIMNFAKATKSFTSFSTKNTAEATRLKNRILTAVGSGVIKFKSDTEKNDFIRAINNNDHSYLNKFVTPGMLGKSTFANFLQEVNNTNLELAGVVGSEELATRALNFENFTSLYKREVLNNIIYAAQVGYDSGYFVSEIKKKLKETQVAKIWSQLDTQITFDSLSKKAKDSFIGFVTSSRFGKFAANKADIETLFDLYGGKLSFTGLLKKSGLVYFKKFLNRFGVQMNLDFKWTLKDIMKSRLYELGKLKLLKNLRFLEKGLGLAFKKISGPFTSMLSRGLSGSWGTISRGFSRFLGSFGGFLGSIVGGLGPSGASMARFVRIFSIALLIIILIFILILLPPIQVILGGFNSLSSTRYESESFADQNYGAARPLSGQGNVIASGVFTSGNACVSSDGKAVNETKYSDWNNLTLADFENTRNDNNCRIMCNAKNIMGVMFPGSFNAVNCNALKTIGTVVNENNQFYCTDFVVDAYKQDDPGLVSRLVIVQDRYLESKSGGSGIYEKVELAVPNDPGDTSNIDKYNARCVPLDKFTPGNVFIMRANTCNDTFDSDGKYRTKNPVTGGIESTWGAHVELVLKVVDEEGKKVLYNLSTNHIRKKIRYTLTKCEGPGDTYRLSENDQKAYLGLVMVRSFPCKMYELREVDPNLSCPKDALGNEACIVGPNNYPDFGNYQKVPISRTGVSTPF
jgi:hypothetical protein